MSKKPMGRKGPNVNLTSVGSGMMTYYGPAPRSNPNHFIHPSNWVGSQPKSRSNPNPSRFYQVDLRRLSSEMTKTLSSKNKKITSKLT
jgi:hypothetical protein